MSETAMKRPSDSFTTQVQILTQANLNGYSRLFGGQLMSWMDIVAAVTARRHSERNVTTVKVSDLVFVAPAYANDTLVLTGEIVYVGHTSMEVAVCVYVERLNGERNLINEARFVMVALDEHEHPAAVPGLILETEEQRRRWNECAVKRGKPTIPVKEDQL